LNEVRRDKLPEAEVCKGGMTGSQSARRRASAQHRFLPFATPSRTGQIDPKRSPSSASN